MKKTSCAIIEATILASVSIPLIVAKCEQTTAAVTKESLLKGLVLHFTFDKAETDGKVTDASEKQNDGKASGVKWTANGKKGGAYEFKADGDQIKVRKQRIAESQANYPGRLDQNFAIKTRYGGESSTNPTAKVTP